MKLTSFFFIVLLLSCSPSNRFRQDKTLFYSSHVLLSFRSVADMNDSYFVIRENNFFEFYRELFDSLKNTRYPGKFTYNGDTLLLQFYNKKGIALLGNKALISETKKEIRFFK